MLNRMPHLICLSWNLAHQIREVPIRPEVVEVIDGLGIDIAMFNEFVDGDSRAEFKQRLCALGLEHIRVSTRIGRSNQVMIASRYPLEPGDLRSPMAGTVAPANWFHARLPSHGLELVHLRMPWWEHASTRTAYRVELAALLALHANRRLVVCGDFNDDPFKRLAPDAASTNWLGLHSFRVERPTGEWSYINKKGTATSRVDHVAHTHSAAVSDARYQTTFGDVILAGQHVPRTEPEACRPISDHAPLVFTIHPA